MTIGFIILMLSVLFLSSCHNLLKEKELIIESAEIGDLSYKYKYHISAYPTYQVLYSDEVYNVGDTLKYCR